MQSASIFFRALKNLNKYRQVCLFEHNEDELVLTAESAMRWLFDRTLIPDEYEATLEHHTVSESKALLAMTDHIGMVRLYQ